MGQRASESFFESPHAVTYILILLNSAMFAVTLFGNSLTSIDPATLYHYGALYKPAFERHEHWRLITYAFLHGNIIHFGLNMLCIGAWAGMLENRLGATYFLAVYLASAVGGGIASMEGHAGAFLSVGASGAISGIVGGLLCLTILGKLPLSPQFFVVVIGINVLFSANAAHVDWLAHLGGFTAGFAACALLDVAENLNRYWLRCKFPEFVKSGLAAAFTGAALLYFEQGGRDGTDSLAPAIAAIAGLAIAIKLADIVLVRPKGLAVMAVAAAVFWGFLGYAAGAVAAGYQLYSSIQLYGILPSAEAFREHKALWPMLLAAGGFLAALFLLRTELRRGLNDPGFVATSLTAERRRRQGL
jgi:membrane associated rhomboid family serine protease